MNLMEKWKKFFTDAGVPASDAATYAYKFAHNRIQTDMLTELNKDYLKEMGITIMGDVIAILRHSKHVYEELQKSGKTELQDEVSKEPRKDKEVASRNQKSHIESNATKKESKVITKSVSNNTSQKRKLEPTSAPSKKMTKEPPKKIPHPILNSDNIEECEDLGYVMIDTSKKASISQKLSNVEKQLKTAAVNKKEEKLANRLEDIFNMSEDDDEDDDNVEVIINDPILTPFGGYKRYPMQEKYDIPYTKNKDTSKLANPQLDTGKRTVFKRLGDDISQHSVTSTTAFEDEEQQIMNAKKFKDDSSKLPQEKNSVFHRLGQKCDVSSTSADANEKFLDEDKKVDIKLDPIDAKKSNQLRELPVKRKVKPKEESNAPPSTFTIKPTYTEGILAANSRKEHKPSLKERLGIPKSKDLNLRTMSAEVEYIGEIKMRRSYPPEDFYKKTRLVSTSSRKKVSFGSVSEKLIPSREEAIKNGELSLASERVSVFDRLGFNRTL